MIREIRQLLQMTRRELRELTKRLFRATAWGPGGAENARISVVIPNYNCIKYIEKRLESVIRQSIPVHEIIVLDDASTDNSLEAVFDWQKKRRINLKIVRNAVNSGSVFSQWKRGVELAAGEFVWIAEADDLCEPNFLSIVIKPMLSDQSIIVSYCESKQIDTHGNFLSANYDHYLENVSDTRWKKDYTSEGKEELRSSLCVLNSIPNVSAAVFRKKVLYDTMNEYADEIGAFRAAADHALYVRLLEKGNIAYQRKNANIHRKHPDSVTAKNQNKLLYDEITTVQDWVLERYEISGQVMEKLIKYREILKYNLIDFPK
jgi:glycosyltransferase involved in cell wall biosynthesis